MRKAVVAVLFVFMALIASNSEAAVTLVYQPGTTNVTTALTGFSTTGAMMDGMVVTAFFTGGGSQSLNWADTGASSGGVTGTGWGLSQSGDTFSFNWTLYGSGIDRIQIDAGPGNTVFDVLGDAYYTDGSALGNPFTLTSFYGGNITATYKDLVALTGFAPLGDLYRSLDIDFAADFDGTITFLADTDNLQFAGDIKPVPEPGTLLLLGSSLIGIAGLGRKLLRT